MGEALPTVYGGNFSWVGAAYRMHVKKGVSPLQFLNGLTRDLLSLQDMVFTADGGFQRPGECTSLFPQRGVNLRWRWDAEESRIIIDFSQGGNLLSWRWDELRPSSELRFPSLTPDFKGIGHVGKFSFDYVMMSAAAAEEDPPAAGSPTGTGKSGFFTSIRSSRFFSSMRSPAESIVGGQNSSVDNGRQSTRLEETSSGSCIGDTRFMTALHFQIGDRCVAAARLTVRLEQDIASAVLGEFSAGTEVQVCDLGTELRRLKVQSDGMVGWISFVTLDGKALLTKQSLLSIEQFIYQETSDDTSKCSRQCGVGALVQDGSLRSPCTRPLEESVHLCTEVMKKHVEVWLAGLCPDTHMPSSREDEEALMWSWIRDFHSEKNDDWFSHNRLRLRAEFEPVFSCCCLKWSTQHLENSAS